MADLLSIPSKSIPFHYRGYTATLTFERSSKLWLWEFVNVVETKFRGRAKTIDDARKAVRNQIDIIIGPGPT